MNVLNLSFLPEKNISLIVFVYLSELVLSGCIKILLSFPGDLIRDFMDIVVESFANIKFADLMGDFIDIGV